MGTRKYDRTSRLAAAERTRQRIVRATAELHAERGALGTTHEMIARRAEVSIPTVYKYFPSRDALIPACTGLVFSEAPVRLDEDALRGKTDLASRIRALARRTFRFYDYAAPWLRWSAGDAAELPALRAVLQDADRQRSELVALALRPGSERPPPRRLVAVATALLDFPSWQTLTAHGFTSAGAAAIVGETVLALHTSTGGKDTP